MKCNLVKKNVVIHNDKEDKDIKLTNYYLLFESGEILPVECKFYTTKSNDKKDVDKLAKINSINFAKFSVLADKIDHETK